MTTRALLASAVALSVVLMLASPYVAMGKAMILVGA